MKVKLIFLLFFYLFNNSTLNNEFTDQNDILDKLDDVLDNNNNSNRILPQIEKQISNVQNSQFIEESLDSIPESIKDLLKVNVSEVNTNNFKNLVKNTKEETNRVESKKNVMNDNNQILINEQPEKFHQLDPMEFTIKIMKLKEEENKRREQENNKSELVNNDIIFEHIYIDSSGKKHIPNTKDGWIYDPNTNEFVLPDEIKREDDITKFLRIESILETMTLTTKNEQKLPYFRNPPILKGLEINMKQINKNDKNKISEKLSNFIIKRKDKEMYFNTPNNDNTKILIRSPPNFLY